MPTIGLSYHPRKQPVTKLRIVQSQLHPKKIQEDNEKLARGKQQEAAQDRDEIAMSEEARQSRRLAALTTSEKIEIENLSEDRQRMIRQRIASDFYGKPEIEREIVERMLKFPPP